MKRILFFLVVCFLPQYLGAQNPNGNYNPYISEVLITPAPLVPTEEGGTGEMAFTLGNAGSDALEIYGDQAIILTISLSHCLPAEDPVDAISGAFSGHFSWTYQDGTYTGIQLRPIQGNTSGEISIRFRVNKNTVSPGSNGFNVNITPSPYQTASNLQDDDALSTYTYTRKATYIEEEAGSGFEVFPNPAKDEIILNCDGFYGGYVFQIIAANGSIVLQEQLMIQHDQHTISIKNLPPGLYHLSLSDGEQSHQKELIIAE